MWRVNLAQISRGHSAARWRPRAPHRPPLPGQEGVRRRLQGVLTAEEEAAWGRRDGDQEETNGEGGVREGGGGGSRQALGPGGKGRGAEKRHPTHADGVLLQDLRRGAEPVRGALFRTVPHAAHLQGSCWTGNARWASCVIPLKTVKSTILQIVTHLLRLKAKTSFLACRFHNEVAGWQGQRNQWATSTTRLNSNGEQVEVAKKKLFFPTKRFQGFFCVLVL